MRIFCLLSFLIIIVPFASGQNYYVAVVKGKVFYEDRLLKKRDKIKMKGVLRFTSKQDYLKVSGPGGLYTINPGIDQDSGNEFLVAVKEEFFPKIRQHSTSMENISMDLSSQHYFDQKGRSGHFLDKTFLIRKIPDLNEGEELGFLHETSSGLIYKTAQTNEKHLLIREQDFSFKKNTELKQTAIVQVRNKSKWLELISDKDSIAQVEPLVDRYTWGFIADTQGPTMDIDSETGEVTQIEEIPKPAEILDFMGPPSFVNRKKMVKDLRFHLRKCKATDIETFMEDYEFEDYIFDTYGYLREYPDIDDVLRKDLKLTSRYDGSIVPVIID